MSKIVNGPPVRPNNLDSLQTFTDDVRAFVGTLRAMNLLTEVDTRSRLVTLMNRLPSNLISRWRKKAIAILEDTERHASITDFLQFLVKMTKEASDPVFGLAAQHVTKSADTPKPKPTR